MISSLKGKIEFVEGEFIILDVQGVGYKVHLSDYSLGKVVSGDSEKEIKLFIYTHVREDTLALYGFVTHQELKMFELLISISGIGPKAGLGILSIADPKTIRTAILNEDASILTKVSGVGKKTAERVILELRNKIADLPSEEKEKALSDHEAVEALTALGYSSAEARSALKEVSKDIKDVGERVKMALKSLGRK